MWRNWSHLEREGIKFLEQAFSLFSVVNAMIKNLSEHLWKENKMQMVVSITLCGGKLWAFLPAVPSRRMFISAHKIHWKKWPKKEDKDELQYRVERHAEKLITEHGVVEKKRENLQCSEKVSILSWDSRLEELSTPDVNVNMFSWCHRKPTSSVTYHFLMMSMAAFLQLSPSTATGGLKE